jgi:hypothetical protein
MIGGKFVKNRIGAFTGSFGAKKSIEVAERDPQIIKNDEQGESNEYGENEKRAEPRIKISRNPVATAHAVLVGGVEQAFKTPDKINLSRLSTLYEDGGVEAFAEETDGAGQAEIDQAAQGFARDARYNLAPAAFCGALGLLELIWLDWPLALGLLLVAAVFAFKGASSAWRCWQIGEKRLGSVQEFYRSGALVKIVFGG